MTTETKQAAQRTMTIANYFDVVKTFMVRKHRLRETTAKAVADAMALDIEMAHRYGKLPELAATDAVEAVLRDYPELIG